jgi:hypothetical protein
MLEILDSRLRGNDDNDCHARAGGRPDVSFRLGAVAAILVVVLLLAGCEYGYSRSVLEGGGPGPAAMPQGSISVGYQTGWVAPWSFGFSYAYPSSPYWYSPYPYYAYDPWWYYPPRYTYPWYPYPSPYVPYVVPPAPKRTFRFDPEPTAPSPAPSAPPSKSKRRFNFP